MENDFFNFPAEDQQKSLASFAAEMLKSYGLNDAKVLDLNVRIANNEEMSGHFPGIEK